MPERRDPLRLSIEVAVYVILGWLAMAAGEWLMLPIGGYLAGNITAIFAAALAVNWLTLSIYERLPIRAIGLAGSRASAWNLMLGVAGGIGAATLVLAPPLAVGASHFVATPGDIPGAGTFAFVTVFLAIGAAGEEILFRGYAFQLLIENAGPWQTILPVSVLFAWVHSGNPGVTPLALVNTAGFGIIFGYAFIRSRDLWLPIGLHFGWNFTLPVFGVNVSGLRMKITGHELVWSAGNFWSGGAYGPEASVLATAAMVALVVYIWKAPIRRQVSPLLDAPAEAVPCDSKPLPPA